MRNRVLSLVLLGLLVGGAAWAEDVRVSKRVVRALSWMLVGEESQQATVLGNKLFEIRASCDAAPEPSLRVPVELVRDVITHLSPPNRIDDDWRAARYRDELLRELKAAPFCG